MTTALIRRNDEPSALLATCDEKGIYVSIGERKLLKSAVYNPIRDTPKNVLVQDARAIITNVMRDLGISRQPDAYDGARFVDILNEYFGYMTIVDVKQAFEMYVMGELDDILPRGKDGSSFSHYQQFSATFYTKVLQAYRNKQLQSMRAVEGRVHLALLKENTDQRDRKKDRAQMLEILESVAISFSQRKEHLLILTAMAEAVYKRVGLLPKKVEPCDADVITAKNQMSRNKDAAVASGLKNMMEQGRMSDDLYASAANLASRRILRRTCEELGEQEIKKRFEKLRHEQEGME